MNTILDSLSQLDHVHASRKEKYRTCEAVLNSDYLAEFQRNQDVYMNPGPVAAYLLAFDADQCKRLLARGGMDVDALYPICCGLSQLVKGIEPSATNSHPQQREIYRSATSAAGKPASDPPRDEQWDDPHDIAPDPAPSWLSRGGTTPKGTVYGAPFQAKPWGQAGCPLLPRYYRERYGTDAVPPALGEALGARDLTVSDLDADILARQGLQNLGEEGQRVLRDMVTHWQIPAEKVAVPAGVPAAWVLALPLGPRILNKLRRDLNTPALLRPLACGELLGFHGLGKGALADILCVLESAELRRPRGNDEDVPASTGKAQKVRPPGERISPEAAEASRLDRDMRMFVSWALAETEAATIGEAIQAATERPAGVGEWTKIAATLLQDAGAKPKAAADVLDAWGDQLPARDKTIFARRIAPLAQATLQEVADRLGITPERVRQLERALKHRLKAFLQQDAALPLRWRVASLKHKMGVAIKETRAEPVLAREKGCRDYRGAMLELAGPYVRVGDWLVQKSALRSDPTAEILASADRYGRLDEDFVRQTLEAWGLDRTWHTQWLKRHGRVRRFNKQLVVWGSAMGDRLALGLSEMGQPASVEAIMQYVDEKGTKRSAQSALAIDDRFIRVNRSEWGLSAWGLPEYRSIVTCIKSLLEESGQPLHVDEVVYRLAGQFGLKKTSVRAYCSAPMFVTEDGCVRLRTRDDPYVYPDDALASGKGVFVLDNARVSLLLRVDADMLRGSGKGLSLAVGAALGMFPGERLSFQTAEGDEVDISFPWSALNGPSSGSLRKIAERKQAAIGDYLTLVFHVADRSMEIEVTKASEYAPGWELVARLTGVRSDRALAGLADALQCAEGQVRAALRARNDAAVLEALPSHPTI